MCRVIYILNSVLSFILFIKKITTTFWNYDSQINWRIIQLKLIWETPLTLKVLYLQ